MKLNRPSRSRANDGSVLLVAVGTVIVLGIILAAILSLITQERRILTRTAAWNTALPAAEAGIEEAMSHLRQVNGGSRAVNGWQADGSSFVMTRYLTNTETRYTVGINSATPPVILSVGEAWCPSAGKYIQRRVQVTTTNLGNFHQGMVARRRIAMSGGFVSDSFDSSKPALSTNGQYDPAKRSDKGNVASNSSEPGAVTLSGGVQVYGSISTGPTGTVSIANNSSVGSASWINSGKKGIQPDYYTADMNASFDPASLPYTTGQTPQGGAVNGVTYKYILQDGIDYQLSTLDIKGSDYMYVSGKARLIVDKDIKATAGGTIHIATNASLEVTVKKGSVSLTGGSILNDSGQAASFSLIGLSALSDISISGGFIGTIYAPDTTLSLSGGGEISGAIIVAEISARGSYKFHYDEALTKNKPQNLVINSWVEL